MVSPLPTPVQHSQSDLGLSSICEVSLVQWLCDLFGSNPRSGQNKGETSSDIGAPPPRTVTTRAVTVPATPTLLSHSSTTSHSLAPTAQPTSVRDATATSLQTTGPQKIGQSSDDSSSKFSSSESLDASNTLIPTSTKTTPSGTTSETQSTSTLIIPGNSDTIFVPPHIPSETRSSSTSAPVVSGTPHKGVDAGAIAGGILGVLVFLLLVFYAIVLCRRRRRRGPPSAEFLNWSFQRRSPSVAESSTSYAFGSAYATSSHKRSSTSHTTTTIGRGFKFPPLHT